MPGKLSEHRGQALAGADGGRAHREIQGVTGDSGSRLHLPGHQEGVRIELERPDWRYNRTTILDRETLRSLLEATPEATVRSCMRFR